MFLPDSKSQFFHPFPQQCCRQGCMMSCSVPAVKEGLYNCPRSFYFSSHPYWSLNCDSPSRKRNLSILPCPVLGSSGINSMTRGYLWGANFSLQYNVSSFFNDSDPSTPSVKTT